MTELIAVPSLGANSTVLPINLDPTRYLYDDTSTEFLHFLSTDLTIDDNMDGNLSFNSTGGKNRTRGVEDYYPIIITEMVLSIIGLIITIFVYSVLPEFRNVHGKNLITLSACLLTTFTFLTLDILLRKFLPFEVCYAFALVVHITFLGTFFWTHVMAYDIWRTMSQLKPRSEANRGTSNKYLNYSIYAWSATILTTLPAIVLDRTSLVHEDYRPMFGVKRCWLTGKTAFLIYFNAPVGVLLFSNFIMFVLTAWSLIKIKKLTEKLNVKQHQNRFHLYLKLFLVMGIIWTTEFLPWATGIYMLYALAGILTALHGVLLFIIFVCKRRILKQICTKFEFSYFGGAKETTNSKKTLSSTSQPLTLSSSSSALDSKV